MTVANSQVSVRLALASETASIENLMQFYNYDLSESVPVDFAATGLYPLRPKNHYWSKSGVVSFLIYVDDALAGFAVIDDEVIQPASRYNMGYFFIARRYRGRGVGSEVAGKLFSQFPGAWEIYFYSNNKTASRFWHGVIAKSLARDVVSLEKIIDSGVCELLSFSTATN